jgi:hypothetical protein
MSRFAWFATSLVLGLLGGILGPATACDVIGPIWGLPVLCGHNIPYLFVITIPLLFLVIVFSGRLYFWYKERQSPSQ